MEYKSPNTNCLSITKFLKKIKSVIMEIRPDIIHVHNILPAKIASEFYIPFVFDDHEYLSNHSRLFTKQSR
jgi:hypothetical protein